VPAGGAGLVGQMPKPTNPVGCIIIITDEKGVTVGGLLNF